MVQWVRAGRQWFSRIEPAASGPVGSSIQTLVQWDRAGRQWFSGLEQADSGPVG